MTAAARAAAAALAGGWLALAPAALPAQRAVADAVLPTAAIAPPAAEAAAVVAVAATAAEPAWRVDGDAIVAPLTDQPADAARGRAIVTNRQIGLCLLCHSGPFPEERFQGTLAPTLAGVGSRYGAGQLRLRIADGRRLNPASVMPSYARTDGLQRVGAAWRGKPLLSAQQIEDVVAFLGTLREP